MGPIFDRFAQQTQEPAQQTAPAEMTLENAILKGLKQETAQLTGGCWRP